MGSELGFTGTRNEPSNQQKLWLLDHVLESVCTSKEITRISHGCCIGADAYMHRAAKNVYDMGLEEIILHPPLDRSREMEITEWDMMNCLWYPRKSYLPRNRDIASACDRLVALPDRPETVRGSGTWYTIHAADEYKKPVLICYPDGRVEER